MQTGTKASSEREAKQLLGHPSDATYAELERKGLISRQADGGVFVSLAAFNAAGFKPRQYDGYRDKGYAGDSMEPQTTSRLAGMSHADVLAMAARNKRKPAKKATVKKAKRVDGCTLDTTSELHWRSYGDRCMAATARDLGISRESYIRRAKRQLKKGIAPNELIHSGYSSSRHGGKWGLLCKELRELVDASE